MKLQHLQTFTSALKKISAYAFGKTSLLILCAYAMSSHADYQQIIEEDFWSTVYPDGGQTFYCRSAFAKPSPVLNVGHVYPSSWISEHLGCRSERTCLRTNEQYSTIISDMHNMVPVEAYHYFKIKGSIFGNLDDTIEASECGVKKRLHIIDPPDAIKGDVARIHFYMHQHHKLPLNSNFAFLKEWHKADPPDAKEKARNKRIQAAQGNDNPFVSQPNLVESLDL